MIVQLTEEQVSTYELQGFLLLLQVFSPADLSVMCGELPGLFAEDSARRVVEKDGRAVRSVYGAHASNDVFRCLSSHPRLLEPAVQLLGGPVYVYQFKINAKVAFVGDTWEWHQDFIFWQREDGVREPRLVTISVFLDDVTEFNGQLLRVAGSHRQGVISPTRVGGVPDEYAGSPEWISNLTADLKYSIDRESLTALVERGGIAAPKGQAGSVLFFHCNAVHGSVPNLSPFDRRIALITYNRVDNVPLPREQPRPDFLVSRDTGALSPVADDALLTYRERAAAAAAGTPAAVLP
jgi:ectoine hydroxylase